MIDARQYVYDALSAGCGPPVRGAYPEDGQELPLPVIIYTEISNVNSGKWHDTVDYQIDAYAGTLQTVRDVLDQADDVMIGLGFRRTYCSSDSDARRERGLWHKVANYRAEINTYDMTIYTGGVYG